MYRWEEYHTGTLYLSAFSGPVEGILMICVIYLITALHPLGPGFWATPTVDLIPGHFASDLAAQADKMLGWNGSGLRDLGVGVSFMIIGALGTVGNIVNRCVCLSFF
jgi:ethanolaminephosphotransferase